MITATITLFLFLSIMLCFELNYYTVIFGFAGVFIIYVFYFKFLFGIKFCFECDLYWPSECEKHDLLTLCKAIYVPTEWYMSSGNTANLRVR